MKMEGKDFYKTAFDYHCEKTEDNIRDISDILLKQRGYVYQEPKGETVILLFSGGMDSTTLIDMVIQKWGVKVIPLFFIRDAKNEKEEEKSVDYFYKYFKEKYPNNVLELVKLKIQIPSRTNKQFFDRNRQEIFGLPLRNATMWMNAMTQAVYLSNKYQTTIRTILIGSVVDDGFDSIESGYLPALSMTLSSCICLGFWYYQILPPFMTHLMKYGGIFKSDLVRYCIENKIPIDKTRSCFEEKETPCGLCRACVVRNEAIRSVSM